MKAYNISLFMFYHQFSVFFDKRKARRLARKLMKSHPQHRKMYKDIARNCHEMRYALVIGQNGKSMFKDVVRRTDGSRYGYTYWDY